MPSTIRVCVAGPSMEPTCRFGAIVEVELGRVPRVGDVGLFATRDGSANVLHRVLARGPGFVVHCGDHGLTGGFGIVRTPQVLGRAQLKRQAPPWLGRSDTPRLMAREVYRRAKNLLARA